MAKQQMKDPLDVFLQNRILEQTQENINSSVNDIVTKDQQRGLFPKSLPGTKKTRICISAYMKMSEILTRMAGLRTVTSALYDVSYVSTKTIRAVAAYYEIPVDVLNRRNVVKLLLDVLFYTPNVVIPSAHARMYATDTNISMQELYDDGDPHDNDDDRSDRALSIMSDLVTNLSVYKNDNLEDYQNMDNVRDALSADMDYSYDPRPRAHQRFSHGTEAAEDEYTIPQTRTSHAILRWSDTLFTHAPSLIQNEAVSFFSSILGLIALEDSILLSPNSKVQAIRRLNRLYVSCGARKVFDTATLQQLHYNMTNSHDRLRSKSRMLKNLGFS